ncbi:UV damage repair endonuclease UvdE [candidate division TA06 bacterium DG_26]|uniref:UV damage repair endonuclease UvdE n=1 Tax=candidate division TA06 bacterium DG_26 TaxID=1703771 RepID=A0A0S7WEQ5_UNCT6|nr:MAG: UV damage repair endonuclease UvdE [candidate division TA06 bacterium DG_26]
MRIGYPCINRTVECKGDRTFRLKSYSESRLVATVTDNLNCLLKMLQFNTAHDILFFRITSDLVPFASHPICQFDWQQAFLNRFQEIGEFTRSHYMRLSMHPDQFTLINSVDERVFETSVRELIYHATTLDSMGLDCSAKIQIHLGGVYGDKRKSMHRFVQRFHHLPERIKGRLVIENDDRNYTLNDCMTVYDAIGIPVVLDVFHHEVNGSGETLSQAFHRFVKTWTEEDGLPIVHYSSQRTGSRRGSHAESIDLRDFHSFLEKTKPFDFDVMLEIKDKEKSAVKAVKTAMHDDRFLRFKTE